MISRSTAHTPSTATQTDLGLRGQVATLADALLARGVGREQATRLAIAMVEACAARWQAPPRRPS